MTESKERISHQPEQQPAAHATLRFEDSEGNRRKLLASQDIIPVLSTLKRNMNRYGMGGVTLVEAADQEETGGLIRMELSAAYSHPLDFLSGEMSRAVTIWRELQVQGDTGEGASYAVENQFSPERMKTRYGEFYTANRQAIFEEQKLPVKS